MFRYFISFFWALPFFLFYYHFNHAALEHIHQDLYERFNFRLTGGLSLYSYIYFISDYIIINLTLLGVVSAIKRTEVLRHKVISITSGLSAIATILCHKYLLQIDLIASYYTITSLMILVAFIYIIIRRKGTLVANFLITVTSFALYLFIAFIHSLYIYYNLHHTEDVLYKEDSFAFELIQESINNNTFDKTSRNLGIDFDYKKFFFANNDIENISNKPSVTIGVNRMIDEFRENPQWSASFVTIDYDRSISDNHVVTKVSKSQYGYTVEEYIFKIEVVYPIYKQFFFVIYCSILSFSTVWISGLFKLMSIHKKVKMK